MAKYRVPVLVDREQYENLKRYADITGDSVASVVRQALQDFEDTVIATKLESLDEIVDGTFTEAANQKAAISPQVSNIIPFNVSGIGNA